MSAVPETLPALAERVPDCRKLKLHLRIVWSHDLEVEEGGLRAFPVALFLAGSRQFKAGSVVIGLGAQVIEQLRLSPFKIASFGCDPSQIDTESDFIGIEGKDFFVDLPCALRISESFDEACVGLEGLERIGLTPE